jgi:RNA polymerase sigma-70 factor (ECF subfamily)
VPGENAAAASTTGGILPEGTAMDFATTRWSLVLQAGNREQPEADEALALLCEQYWIPLYAYVRRRITGVEEAQDLTQEFFARLLEKNVVHQAAPERGRFRSFLLTALKNFLTNEWDRVQAQKRGGGRRKLTLDFQAGESRVGREPAHDLTPERLFEQQWALTLLELVLTRLKAEYMGADKARTFEVLTGTLTADSVGSPYSELAAKLDLSEEAVRQAAHRLRKRTANSCATRSPIRSPIPPRSRMRSSDSSTPSAGSPLY